MKRENIDASMLHIVSIENDLSYLSKIDIQKKVYRMMSNNSEIIPQLGKIEDLIKRNPWVKNVKVYKDKNQQIKIHVEERIPIARIYRENFSSFYIDDDTRILDPRYIQKTPRVPVCLDFPNYRADTAMLKYIAQWTKVITANKNLSAELSYFDYIDDHTIDIVCKQGSPTATIATDKDPYETSRKLAYFYADVLPIIGWTYYKNLNFTYNNIVVSTKN